MNELSSTWRAFGSTAFDESLGTLRAHDSARIKRSFPREPLVLRLAGTPPPDVLAFARRCSARAVLEGVATIYIELDALVNLNFPVIGTLISILRDAHERSAEVVLRTGREDVLKALRVTALDKIFTIDVPAENVSDAVTACRALEEIAGRPR